MGVHLERHGGKRVAGELQGEVIGLRFHGHGHLDPRPQLLYRAFRGTLELSLRRTAAPKTVSKVLGTWTWLDLLWRPSLSVYHRAYNFIESDEKKARFFPGATKEEFLLQLCLEHCHLQA